jgi:K+ transporter
MERIAEVISVLFVTVGVVWFLVVQGSGIMHGLHEWRGRKHKHPKRRPF